MTFAAVRVRLVAELLRVIDIALYDYLFRGIHGYHDVHGPHTDNLLQNALQPVLHFPFDSVK
ncbi:hypothetical protein D3C73_1388340 [compost metagenome]